MRKLSAFISAVALSLLVLFGSSPASASVTVTPIPVSGWASGLTHDDQYVYSSILNMNQVVRIDPSNNTVVDTFQMALLSQPYEMVIVDGYLYTADFWNASSTDFGTVSRINLSTGQVTNAWSTLTRGFKAEWITANSNNILVSGQGGKIARIPINTPQTPVYYTPTSTWTTDIVATDSYAYVAMADNSGLGGIARIDLTTGAIENQWVNTGKTIGLALAGDYLYAGSYVAKTINKIRVSDGVIVATSVPATAAGAWLISIAGGKIYAAQLSGGVATFDANTLAIEGDPYVTPGNKAYDTTTFAGSLWVTGYNDNKVYRVGLSATPALSPSSQGVSNATVGKAFATSALTPSNFTTAVSFSISPNLPAGLSFNTANGQITGTPTAVTPMATYTITATGTDVVTTTVSFAVEVPSLAVTSGKSINTPGLLLGLFVVLLGISLYSGSIAVKRRQES